MQSPPIRQVSTGLIAALSLLSLAWYATFVFDPGHAGHPVAYALLVLAELIGMSQLIGAWLTILIAPQPSEPFRVAQIKSSLQHASSLPGTVAAFVTVAGEPLDTIRETVTAARDMHIPHRTVILDDGASDDVASLARELGVEYVRRADRRGWKAGNLNHGLSVIQPDFIAVFDSDHIAKPHFLLETLPYLLADERLAFVQTPQHYHNTSGFLSGGSAEAQEVFYRHIQSGKNAFNASFCVGTNVLFRREALDEIGGFYEKSNSEDIWTSILLHEAGWNSFFLPQVLASGEAPDTVDKYFRQQYRWATGGLEIFFRRNPLFRPLTFDQKVQYLHSSMFYLTGVSVAILFLLPLLFVYFGWRPIEAQEGSGSWALHFLPYYALTFASTAHFLGRWPKWATYVVALTAFPSHLAGALSAAFRIRLRWSVTGVIRRRTDYILAVSPHLLLLLLSLGAIPIVLAQQQEDMVLAGMTAFWLCWNSIVLFSICKRAIPRFAHHAVQQPAYQYAS